MSPKERAIENSLAIYGAGGGRIVKAEVTACEAKIELDDGRVLTFTPFRFNGGTAGLRVERRDPKTGAR